MKPNITYDPLAKALYIDLEAWSSNLQTFSLGPNVFIDISTSGEIAGLEILDPTPELITMLERRND